VKHQIVSAATIAKMAARSTQASAKLEGRQVPDDYVRSEATQRLIDALSARRGAVEGTDGDVLEQQLIQPAPKEISPRSTSLTASPNADTGYTGS
jgi:hypothetical protein